MKEGWEVKRFSDAFLIKPPKAEAKQKISGQDFVSFVPMNNLGDNSKFFDVTQEKTLNEVSGSYTYFADNDVLLAKITPCFENGKLGIAKHLTNGIGFGSSEYIVFRSTGIIDSEFLYYYLSQDSFRNEGKRVMSGAVGHKRVPKDFIENYLIPIPPLPEQKRIVAILDEVFAGIATAIANAEKNFKNARELFESYLNSVFTEKGDGWVEKKLGDVCIVERGSSPRPIKKYQTDDPNGVNWVKIGDTKNVDKYICSTKEKITVEGAKKSRFVGEGDFILSNSMSFGKPFIMRTSGYIHDGWFVLRLKDEIDKDYFYNLLISPFVQKQFSQLSSGAIVKNINSDLTKSAVLPIPPLAEQKNIVEKLDGLSNETKRLEIIYQQKLDSLAELKQSILQKAFAGELTAETPKTKEKAVA